MFCIDSYNKSIDDWSHASIQNITVGIEKGTDINFEDLVQSTVDRSTNSNIEGKINTYIHKSN